MDVVVGVDVGTTGAKAVAFGADGVARAQAHRTYALHSPAPGREEQDPAEVVDATVAAVRDAVAQCADGGLHVAGLVCSTAMHSLVGLDARGRPVTPLLTWADSRAAQDARRLHDEPGGLALHRRTGTPVHPMSPLLKLRWLREHEPEVGSSRVDLQACKLEYSIVSPK